MERIEIEIRFKIGILCALLGFIAGLFTIDLETLAKSTDLGIPVGLGVILGLFGFSALPFIIYEFSNPQQKLYLVCGSIGISFVRFAIKVFESDGALSMEEISKIDRYMQKEYGPTISRPLLDFIAEDRVKPVDLEAIAKPIHGIKLSERVDLLHRLFLMVSKERIFNIQEEEALRSISKSIRIKGKRFDMLLDTVLAEKGYKTRSQQEHEKKQESWNSYLKDRLIKNSYNPYLVLGIDQSASDSEIKRAYRRMVKKFHPDKSMQSPEEKQIHDAQKIIEINEAYESIKKMRGIH